MCFLSPRRLRAVQEEALKAVAGMDGIAAARPELPALEQWR